MKITIDIPDDLIATLEYESEDMDMNLEEYLAFLIKKSWL